MKTIFRKRDLIKVLIFALLLAVFILLTQRVGTYQGQEESKMVHDAIHRAVLTCYAVEGAYPEDLEYLKQNYQQTFHISVLLISYSPRKAPAGGSCPPGRMHSVTFSR